MKISKTTKVSLIFGVAVPVFILVFGIDLAEFTIVVWPSYIFLMALGGEMDIAAFSIIVTMSILVNMALYFGIGYIIKSAFSKVRDRS